MLRRFPTAASSNRTNISAAQSCPILFVFVANRKVLYTDNASQRALRPSVEFRKATCSFRAAWGAEPFVGLQGCRLLNIRLIMIQIRCQSKLFATGRRGVAVIVSFRSRRVS